MENKGFELIAKKARASYTAAPEKYHPKPPGLAPGFGIHAIALIVCGAAAYALAYYTEPYVLEGFRSYVPALKKAKALTGIYYAGLIAYYTVAAFVIYVLFEFLICNEHRMGDMETTPLHPGWHAAAVAAMSITAMIPLFTLFVVILPGGDKVALAKFFAWVWLLPFAFLVVGMTAVDLCYRWSGAYNDK